LWDRIENQEIRQLMCAQQILTMAQRKYSRERIVISINGPGTFGYPYKKGILTNNCTRKLYHNLYVKINSELNI
jgi:hypothetical protein